MTDFLRPRRQRDGADDRSTETRGREQEPARAALASAALPPTDFSSDLGSVGEHIASVLAAAEAAASRLRSDADQDARRVREEAAEFAEDLRTRAAQEAQAERANTRTMVEEAEAKSHRVRAEADRYADDRRQDADRDAAEIIREAEARAATIADDAAERHGVVLADIAASENRLRDLAESLRNVAGTLEAVADGEGPDGAEATRRPRRAKPSADADESLEETLKPSERANQPQEMAAE